MSEEKKGKLLKLVDGGPDDEMVAMLEKALKDAREGIVTGGALLLQGPGGALSQDLGGVFHSGDLMLQLKALEIELVETEFGAADDDEDPVEDPDDDDSGSDDDNHD